MCSLNRLRFTCVAMQLINLCVCRATKYFGTRLWGTRTAVMFTVAVWPTWNRRYSVYAAHLMCFRVSVTLNIERNKLAFFWFWRDLIIHPDSYIHWRAQLSKFHILGRCAPLSIRVGDKLMPHNSVSTVIHVKNKEYEMSHFWERKLFFYQQCRFVEKEKTK